MKLVKLTLHNFKGVKDFTLEAGGHDTTVLGANAAGKTTVYDAYLWLLFGKDSQNKADNELKTRNPDGTTKSGLDHSVEGVFEGLTLKRLYKEVSTKKRGSVQAEFTGHTTEYFINGVPVQKKEYDDRVAGLCNADRFKLLTSPTFFNEQLPWQKRREVLIEVCGDISDADVIASNAKLSELPAILGDRTLDDHRKVIAARRTEINKELQTLPARIDEVELGLPDVSGLKVDVLTGQKIALEGKRSNKEKELARMEAGGEVAEKKKALAKVETKIIEIENQHRAGANEAAAGKSDELRVARGMLSDLSAKKDSFDRRISANLDEVKRIEARAATLRETWGTENDKEFTADGKCPTCKQDLPAAEIETARAAFNKAKSEKLEQITADGKALAEQIKGIEEACALLAKEGTSLEAEMVKAKTLVDGLGEDVSTQAVPALSENPAYQAAQEAKAEIETAILALEQEGRGAIAAVEQEIESINAGIQAVQNDLAKFDQRVAGEGRIDELKAQEKELAAEFEELERQLFLTEEFIRAKVSMLTDRINSKFSMARFSLFETQVNGGISEVCNTTYQGVPYEALNHAARINIGLDIINTLSDHYGFTAPIFIDGRESVTELIDAQAQIINLIVSEKDKALRVVSELEKVKEIA